MNYLEKLHKSLGVTPEELAPLRENSETKRIFELLTKIEDGTITPEERAEFDELTKEAREMDPNVLKG
jgi:hypothetical protein